MITLENHLGKIEICEDYFKKLIGTAATSCFGVAGMSDGNVTQGIRSKVYKKRSFIDKGVIVTNDANGISIDLHIIITYGMNIRELSKSIDKKVRYTVNQATDIKVNKIKIFVDSLKNE